MSGGSYDYLFVKEPRDLFDMEPQIKEMAQRLLELGYAGDAAQETIATLLKVSNARESIKAQIDKLSEIWKAVEYWDSSDWGEDKVKDALAKYDREHAVALMNAGGAK